MRLLCVNCHPPTPTHQHTRTSIVTPDRIDVPAGWGLGAHDRPPTALPEGGYPSWQQEWAAGCHTDVQLTRSDWDATPRRNRMEVRASLQWLGFRRTRYWHGCRYPALTWCSPRVRLCAAQIWLWLTDVPADRGAMRIIPGSMNHIMVTERTTKAHQSLLPVAFSLPKNQESPCVLCPVSCVLCPVSCVPPFPRSCACVLCASMAPTWRALGGQDHWEQQLTVDQKAALPRVHGAAPVVGPQSRTARGAQQP